jgi:hypothetical protein
MTARAIVTVQLRLALALATMPGQYRALVAHGPLPQTPEGAFFYTHSPPRHAELGSASASCARAVARIARGFRGGAIRREGSAQRSASEGEASPFLNIFYLQINTEWNIPIWNFDNLSIAIFILHWFLACANYTLISGW